MSVERRAMDARSPQEVSNQLSTGGTTSRSGSVSEVSSGDRYPIATTEEVYDFPIKSCDNLTAVPDFRKCGCHQTDKQTFQ